MITLQNNSVHRKIDPFLHLTVSIQLLKHEHSEYRCLSYIFQWFTTFLTEFRGDRKYGNLSYTNESDYKHGRDFWFLFIAAIIITFLALTRLVMETFQLLLRRLTYLSDWINWMENILFAFSIVFVWVLNTDCYCTYNWQWQIGTFAVFLAWINLLLFAEKIPLTGLYIVMFLHIFHTFLRTIVLGFLLVIAFALAFYMIFYDPNAVSLVIMSYGPILCCFERALLVFETIRFTQLE